MEKELSLSIRQVWLLQIASILYFVPFVIWNEYWYGSLFAIPGFGNPQLSNVFFISFVVLFFLLYIALQGMGFHFLAKVPFKDIRLVARPSYGDFGILSEKPFKIGAFRKIKVFPPLALISMAIIGELLFHNIIWSWMILFTLLTSIFDMACLIQSRCEKRGLYVAEHPKKVAYKVFDQSYLEQHYPEYATDQGFPQYQH